MSVRRLHPEQPKSFAFTQKNLSWAKKQIAKYPKGRQASAVLPLLWRAQEQEGWLSEAAMKVVGDMLDMAPIRVLEVASFYTMFTLSPVGEHFIQLCGTTPCWLRGADRLKEMCKEHIGEERVLSKDGKFSWMEVECLGACVNAPMVQINDRYFEDLDEKTFTQLLEDLKEGKTITAGPQNSRFSSEPERDKPKGKQDA